MDFIYRQIWKCIPAGLTAFACFSRIYIRPGHRLSKDQWAHEEHHLEQQEKYGKLRWLIRYFLDRQFKLEQEVEAYRVQVKNGASLVECAKSLATNYGLDLTKQEAFSLIRGE